MKYYIMNGCNNFYCPQTKFAKVMFSQVSVCPPPGRHTPPADTTGYGQQAGGTHPTGMHSCDK